MAVRARAPSDGLSGSAAGQEAVREAARRDGLVDAVGRFGPVSVAFQVASDFQHYSGGVYTSTVCGSGPEDVNHAVLAVGYDHDAESGLDYWIVKNSREAYGMHASNGILFNHESPRRGRGVQPLLVHALPRVVGAGLLLPEHLCRDLEIGRRLAEVRLVELVLHLLGLHCELHFL